MAYYPTGGQFGAGRSNPQFGGTPWQTDWWQVPDPTQAMQGPMNDVRRQAASQFNSAANRLGQMGMGQGGVIQDAYGGISTDAARQMAEIGNKYAYGAAENEANRRLTAQQGAADTWNQQQNRGLTWAQTQGGWNQQNSADYWARQYDSMLRGGSTDYMNKWQQSQTPWAQSYARSANPWA